MKTQDIFIPMPRRINVEIVVGGLKQVAVVAVPLLIALAVLFYVHHPKPRAYWYMEIRLGIPLLLGCASVFLPRKYKLQGTNLTALKQSRLVFDALAITRIDLSKTAITELELTSGQGYPAVRLTLAGWRGSPSKFPYYIIYDPQDDAVVREQLLPVLEYWKAGYITAQT